MRWIPALCVIWLICVILPASTVMAASGGTGVTGTVPLVTYEVSASNIGYFEATISWKTNDNATSQVFYDTVSHEQPGEYSYSRGGGPTLLTEHSFRLTGLSTGMTYYYRVRSEIPGTDLVAVSDEHTFTTPTAYELTITSTAGGMVIEPGKGVFTRGAGATVYLIAEPEWGYQFVNWTGDVDTIADVNAGTTIITMDGDYSITANFEEIPPASFNWPLIGGIIAAVILAGLVIFFLSNRGTAQDEGR